MKVLIVFFGLCAIALAQQRQYTNQFDNINVDQVLGNDRILTSYIKCLLEKGPCTREGRELKRVLPDALQSDCSKCTEVQRRNSRKVITFLRSHRPGDWNKLLKRFDPSGAHRARIEASYQ